MMGLFGRSGRARAEPKQKRSVAIYAGDTWDDLSCVGYTNLAHNPEILAGVDAIARLVSSMTIHLMQNTDAGDVRLQNALSRKIDIEPNHNMTRTTFIYWIVRNMILEGRGNVVVWPKTVNGLLDDLVPIPPAITSYVPRGTWDYEILINGIAYDPADMLHFVLNPRSTRPWQGEGYQVALADVANNLRQAATTEKGFMESKWKPSIIVKVDGLVDEFSSPEGRKKLLDSYVSTTQAGEPWIIPSEQFSVEQVRPLSLADLAISDVVTLDKRTVASILGVPPFVLGVGDFNRDAWNNFINSTIMPIARILEQEMTKKLLYSPGWYFRFNARSLYSYSLSDIASIGDEQFVRGIMTGNEVRDWIGLSPKAGLDELTILENYIPLNKISDQKKLSGGGE